MRLRAERLGVDRPHAVLAETELDAVCDAIALERPGRRRRRLGADAALAPTWRRRRAASPRCARRRIALLRLAKRDGITIVLVGHVTKDGAVAGPRVLEHLVDAVLQFEGDRYRFLRVLRAVKNRFGSTNEIGMFEMTDAGLGAGGRPVGGVRGDGRARAPGSVLLPAIEGTRPILRRGAGAGAPRATWPCRAAPRPASTATGWR